MGELLTPLETLLVLLPALAANGSPVLIHRRGTPIDGGRRAWDGRPLLGAGKTFEGLLLGFANGSALAALFSAATGNPNLAVWGSAAALSALLGDITAAFIKRRLGLPRGAPAPILDQLDFYAGALIGLYLAGAIVHVATAAMLAPLVVALHRATNWAAYKLKLKDVPW